MNLKMMQKNLTGVTKVFEGKKVFYMNPYDLRDHLDEAGREIIRHWNGICIYPSKLGKPNKCFYFNWGWGGSPEYLYEINIKL